MASTITVTPQELRKIAEELGQYNERLKSQLQEMVAIKNSLNTKWEGTAKEAFNKKFEERATLFDAFYIAIQGYNSVLLNIAERYENVEKRNMALANGMGSSSSTGIVPTFSIGDLKMNDVPCSVMYGSPINLSNIDFKI